MDSEIGIEGNKESILVVDDLRGNRQLLSMLLSPEGYRVYTAENGKQALEIVQDQPLDLILLDIMMPEMNGYETCERLKASPETQHIPVIFLTARNAAQDKVKAFAVGGVDFITKPFNNEEVLARIEVHLTLQRIQKDLQKKNDQLEREITERKKAKAVLQQYAERLRVLNEINQSILAARSPSNVALAAVGRLRQLIPCQRVLIMNISTSGELQMLAVESNGLLKPIDKELYHELFDNPSLNRGLTQGSNDLQDLPQHSSFLKALCTTGVRSYLTVPLFIHDRLVGVLAFESDKPSMFAADHISIANEVAALLAVAISQHRLYQEAQKEREKSDALLLNVLPASVAQDLKETGQTTPREFDNVTIFFSDFVQFTQIAAQQEPAFLIAEMNEIFTTFDAIMERNHCERMKTVGDGYMAVCGLPEEDEHHAHHIVQAALEIIDYVRERNERAQVKWQVRIGIHSGRVVGGVVGIKKYIYDIFGDAVNTAARMQSYSEPMQINISGNTYELVKDSFQFIPRGLLNVRGKGQMEMYFVKTSKPGAD